MSVPFIHMSVGLNERGMGYIKIDIHIVTCNPKIEVLIQHDQLGDTFG